MTFPPLHDLVFGETWSVLDFLLDDRPMVIRLRTGLQLIAGHPKLPHRLRIVWEFEPTNDSGMPDRHQLSQIDACDDALYEVLEVDNHAILAYVSTCDGLRQWVFYTSDLTESARRINEALPHDEPYPIQMEAEPDPDWTEYCGIKARIRL